MVKYGAAPEALLRRSFDSEGSFRIVPTCEGFYAGVRITFWSDSQIEANFFHQARVRIENASI